MARGLTLTVLWLAVACPATPVERPPVSLSLQLATRQSCGVLSGLDYDTSCLAAVHVRVLDAARRVRADACTILDEGPDELRDLLRRERPVSSIGGLSATGVVTFEVSGVHDKGGKTPEQLCADVAAGNRDDLLFWGESAPIDLAAYDDDDGPSPLIRVVVDCRDCTFLGDDGLARFGCAGIVEGVCEPVFPSSFCIPTVSCDKACDESADCFEGARACVDGRCDSVTATGALCSPCNGLGTCADDFVCLERPGQPPFCAPVCPDAVCATGTRCNRLGNGLELAN